MACRVFLLLELYLFTVSMQVPWYSALFPAFAQNA